MADQPRRSYSNATVAALMSLARGGCYAPECGTATVRFLGEEPVLNLEIAHIRALKPDGKRFDPEWTVEQRNSFANLILLCTAHHKRVDGVDGDTYSVEELEEWKRAREADGMDALAGLSGLTEGRLAEMIGEAQEEFAERLGPALEEFGETAPELASLLSVVGQELVASHETSRRLGYLQDTAPMLMRAAEELGHLREGTGELVAGARMLQAMESLPEELNKAAVKVHRAAAAMIDARS